MTCKICKECNSVKSLDHFYEGRGMKDGHLNQCKVCHNKSSKKNFALKMKSPEYVLKRREKGRETARNRGYKRAPKDKETAYRKAQREKFDQKYRARNKLNNALRAGKIIKESCSVCSNSDSEAHHEDYSKPLEVIWLCPKHHASRHVLFREQELKEKII